MFAQGKAGNQKKIAFLCIINTKWCITSEILGGDEAVGQSGGGGREMGGRTRRAQSHGHVHLPKTVEIREIPLNRPT